MMTLSNAVGNFVVDLDLEPVALVVRRYFDGEPGLSPPLFWKAIDVTVVLPLNEAPLCRSRCSNI